MVTEISGAGLNHSVVGQLGGTTQRVVESVRPEAKDVRSESSAVENVRTQSSSTQVSGQYAKLLSNQDSLGKAASVVREIDVTVDKADKLLSSMEEKLGAVVKMYPPYPVNNPERVSLLNGFGGLRRQIDALTFPPPEKLDELGQVLGVNKDVDSSASVSASAVSLIKEPMWDIPSLDPLAANDAEVSKALDQVTSTRSVLEDLQSGMWEDVVSFVQQSVSSEVQNEAGDTRKQLAEWDVRGEQGIGNSPSKLAQAVESNQPK